MDDDFYLPEEYPPIDETEVDLCRSLWLAVAAQALEDAIGISSRSGGALDQANALRWLNGQGEMGKDFRTVCDLAGLDPELLRTRFKSMLRQRQSTGFRCMKKPKLKNRGVENRGRYLARCRRNSLIRDTRKKHFNQTRKEQNQ